MRIKELKEFSEIKSKARSYFCYLFSSNLSNKPSYMTEDKFLESIKKLKRDIKYAESIYILDNHGRVVAKGDNSEIMEKNRRNRAYFYKAVKEKRCSLTNPYPSLKENVMVITASYPLYDKEEKLLYVVCVDISLENLLKMLHPSSFDSTFGIINKYIYSAFSVMLAVISTLLFLEASNSILSHGLDISSIDIKDMFEATILLTLSLSIYDLVKALFEEEVLGHHKKNSPDDIHKTMVRFLGSIIIALSIEALMLVFKSAIIDPNKLIYSIYLMIGISFLLVSLSIYIKTIRAS
jgi:hypothetical protein